MNKETPHNAEVTKNCIRRDVIYPELEKLLHWSNQKTILETLGIKEEDPDYQHYSSMLSELVSNLDHMLDQYEPTLEEIEEAVREAISGERNSITTIKYFNDEEKKQIVKIIMNKVKELMGA